MMSFSEYLEEKRLERDRKIRAALLHALGEDAVMGADAPASAGVDVAPPSSCAGDHGETEVRVPKDFSMTDHSVLGKCPKKDSGFFGKGDFFIPANVLSGETDKKAKA